MIDPIVRQFEGEGLYQYSAVFDAGDFDFDSLYINLEKFGNHGERTGPWDFSLLKANQPLVPSFWVALDGRRVGLWYCQRISIADLEAKRFRGRFAIWARDGGKHELTLTPFEDYNITLAEETLGPDPLDRLEPPPDAPAPARPWGDDAWWAAQREKLATTHALFAEPLRRSFHWVLHDKPNRRATDLMLLIAAERLGGHDGGVAEAIAALRSVIEQPHWGNPTEGGYGHNGDMDCAFVMRYIAWALHALRDELDADLRQATIDKLTLQGDRFVDQALLNRDYWGGSLLQDHGWQSAFCFPAAGMLLVDVIPEARRWLAWALPHARAALNAMPRDGVLPQHSYCSATLYLDEPFHFHNALHAWTGEDIFADYPFAKTADYINATWRRDTHNIEAPAPQSDTLLHVGGLGALLAMQTPDTQRIALDMLAKPKPDGFYHGRFERGYYDAAFDGFLAYDPNATPAPPVAVDRALTHFADAGIVHYRDDVHGATCALRLGPMPGHHGEAASDNPCDRLASVPGDGHFALIVDGKPLLVTPEPGYRMHTFMRSVLLVDERGQHGDVGYPMSIPSWTHPGTRIMQTEMHAGHAATITLDLAKAYTGVKRYTRTLTLGPGATLECRDAVELDEPAELAWLFQTWRDAARLQGDTAVITDGPTLTIEPDASQPLRASVEPTHNVWSYASPNGFRPYDHVRYATVNTVAFATATFRMQWTRSINHD